MFRYVYLVCLILAGALLGAQLLLGRRGSKSLQQFVFFFSIFLAAVGISGTVIWTLGWLESPELSVGVASAVGFVIAGSLTAFGRQK